MSQTGYSQRVDGSVFRFCGFDLDTARFELRSGNAHIALEPRAFDLLRYLVVHRDRVVSKEELLDTLWGDRFVGEAALTTAVRTARIAVDDNGKDQRLIRTVVRRGYQFVGTVEEAGLAVTSSDALHSFPVRLTDWSGLGFAGRAAERRILENACKEVVASGQRQIIFLGGDAGIGKTTLSSVAASAAHRNGALVFYGRCDNELSIPYQPWREVLTDLAADFPDVVAPRSEALGPLVGGPSTTHLESDSSRHALYSAVVDVFDAVTADGRLAVIVLDDLHWAKAESLALIRHLLQRAMTTPVLLIATFRNSDIDAAHPLSSLLADAHREPGCTRLTLDHLDSDELLQLLETVAGHQMDQDGLVLRDALKAETEGNPFFVTEFLRHLTETGRIRQAEDDRWIVPTDLQAEGLPASVREVVIRRVEQLGVDTRQALDHAAIIGREFDLDLLADLIDEPVSQAFERLTPAIANALVSDAGGTFSFAHAIVGHTLYGAMSATARAFAHEAVAEALEQRSGGNPGRAGEIAHHWARAIGPSSTIKAAEYARRAGEHALAQLAPDEAVRWFSQAMELTAAEEAKQQCEILIGLGTAQRQVGDPVHRTTLLEAGHMAIALGNDDALVRSALANNRGETSQFGGVDAERIQILRAAIAARPSGPDAAMLQAVLSIEMSEGHHNSAETTASRAIDLALDLGDDRITARVVRLAESALRGPSALMRRREWLYHGMAAAERSGDPVLRGLLAMSHHEIALESGDRDAMDHERLVRDAFAKRSPEPFVRWTNEQTQFTHLYLDGDLEGAERSANTGLDVGISTAQPEALSAYAAQLFQLRRAQDRLPEVADQLEQFVAENPTLGVFRAALASALCQLGREEEAIELTNDIDHSPGDSPKFWSTTALLWAEVCHTLALPEAAEGLLPVLEDWKNQVASTGATTEGAIAYGLGRALATISRTNEAGDAYDLALEINHRLRSPLFVAKTRIAKAELVAPQQPDRARQIVAEVKGSLESFDFAHLNRRIDELLVRLD